MLAGVSERAGEAETPLYAERLSVPWWMWALWAALVVVLVAIYLEPVGPLLTAAVVLLVGAVSAAGLLAWGSARVVVTPHELVAGRARIPVELLGPPVALDAEDARRVRGRDYNAAAYHLLRGWLPRAVLVEVRDPADPTPYWYVSSRRPEALAAALREAQQQR